jgi:hypothetical protein
VAAGEDHPELAVFDGSVEEEIIDAELAMHVKRGKISASPAMNLSAAERIENLVASNAMNPGRGIIGNAAGTPRLKCVKQGRLNHLFDQVEIAPAEEPSEHSDQPPRLASKEMLHEGGDGFWL